MDEKRPWFSIKRRCRNAWLKNREAFRYGVGSAFLLASCTIAIATWSSGILHKDISWNYAINFFIYTVLAILGLFISERLSRSRTYIKNRTILWNIIKPLLIALLKTLVILILLCVLGVVGYASFLFLYLIIINKPIPWLIYVIGVSSLVVCIGILLVCCKHIQKRAIPYLKLHTFSFKSKAPREPRKDQSKTVIVFFTLLMPFLTATFEAIEALSKPDNAAIQLIKSFLTNDSVA